MRTMLPVYQPDGTVISSSQLDIREWSDPVNDVPPMIGIILHVHPCDVEYNFTARQSGEIQRGIRHECEVLATPHVGHMPDIWISHVIIPPMRHSGLDNYEEDLPRGCTGMLDGSKYDSKLQKIDYSKLDGEWAIIGFMGGKFESPFIMGWWPHPSNQFDLATMGEGNNKTALKQFANNRSRYLRRKNGTYWLVNKYGSVYLDTTESNSQVSLKDNKADRQLVAKGGHIQVDVEKSAQLEINFNEKDHIGPRLGAGSNSTNQVHDEDLPHPDQPVSGSPKKRSTKRTFRRSKEWETLEKTSNLSIWCENTVDDGGQKGEYGLIADDAISLTVKSANTTKGTMINISEGNIQVWSNDGTQINVLNDEIQIATKSGNYIKVQGDGTTLSGKTDIIGPLAIGGPTGEPLVKGNSWVATLNTFLDNQMRAIATLSAACATPPLSGLSPGLTQLTTSIVDFKKDLSIASFLTISTTAS